MNEEPRDLSDLSDLFEWQDELERSLDELRARRESRQRRLRQLETTLVCAQCRDSSDRRAEGWKAYREGDGVQVFCPACAEREFGPTS
jgi:hypothetical protein